MLENKVKINMGGDFAPIPEGKYTLQIADVSQAMIYSKWKGAEVPTIKFEFVVLDDNEMLDSEDKPASTRGRKLWNSYSPSFGKNAHFPKLFKAIYGREITKEDAGGDEGFDFNALVGNQVDAVVEQNESDGKVYANIASVFKTATKLPAIEVEAKPTIVKSTVSAVAPDVADPDTFIDNLEKESAPEVTAEEAELAQAEANAAQLAVKAAKAQVEASKAKVALKAQEAKA